MQRSQEPIIYAGRSVQKSKREICVKIKPYIIRDNNDNNRFSK